MKLTDAKIKALKAEHGDIFLIEVPTEDKTSELCEVPTVSAIFKKPDMKTLGASAKFSESDPMKAGNVIYENCFIEGDELFKTSSEVKLAALKKFNAIFKIREATVKKL